MALAVTQSRTVVGIEAYPVTVEVDLSPGLPAFNIVGLPEAAVKESKDRVRSALQNCRFEFPAKRITVNLAPADIPKHGSHFDLAIALGILSASDQLPGAVFEGIEFIGELALSGGLRPATGTLPMAIAAAKAQNALIIPKQNIPEVSVVSMVNCHSAEHLLDVVKYLLKQGDLPQVTACNATKKTSIGLPDLASVKGQLTAKRALEIAAAGQHNMLMIGPPGTGKSLLASCLPGILPPRTDEEMLESASIYSVRNKLTDFSWQQRSFRNPHSSSSAVALVGGGSKALPGEISLAHHGVLFLDELPEFERKVIEVLREPLETGQIHIARAAQQATYPANFQLIAAMNPSPGARGNSVDDDDWLSPEAVKYRKRLSRPFLDRIDMHIEVPQVPIAELRSKGLSESSAVVRQRVIAAYEKQLNRNNKPNARLTPAEIEEHCFLSTEANAFLMKAAASLGLSARGFHRILRVARTIADLAVEDDISVVHLSEAINLRRLEKLFT